MPADADQPASPSRGEAFPAHARKRESAPEIAIRRATGGDRSAIAALFDASPAIESGDDARRVMEQARTQTLSLLNAAERTVIQRRGADDAERDLPRETDNDADAWLWVASTGDQPGPGSVIGVAALRRLGEHEVELTRIQVHSEHRRMGVATALLERVLGFCHDHGHLKVVLYTDATEAPAISLFRKFKFHFHRARSEGQRDRLEYYLDLYQRPTPVDEGGG